MNVSEEPAASISGYPERCKSHISQVTFLSVFLLNFCNMTLTPSGCLEDKSGTSLRHVHTNLANCMTSHPRRKQSSYRRVNLVPHINSYAPYDLHASYEHKLGCNIRSDYLCIKEKRTRKNFRITGFLDFVHRSEF
jgi:hypothetical protein